MIQFDHNIEELIATAKEGNERSYEQLLNKYDPLLKKLARLYYLRWGEEQDLMQSCRMGLVKAVKVYDKSKGNFTVCLKNCVMSEIYDTLRVYMSKKQNVLTTSESLDNEGLNDELMYNIDNSLETFAKEQILKKYSTLELQVFSMYLDGYSYLEIANKLGINRRKVDNLLYKIKNYLSRIIKED